MKTRGEAEIEQYHIEELWKESERRLPTGQAGHTEKRHRENRAAWYAYHERMREWHARMSEEHEAKALALFGDER